MLRTKEAIKTVDWALQLPRVKILLQHRLRLAERSEASHCKSHIMLTDVDTHDKNNQVPTLDLGSSQLATMPGRIPTKTSKCMSCSTCWRVVPKTVAGLVPVWCEP